MELSAADSEGRNRSLQLSVASFSQNPTSDMRVLVVNDITERVSMERALKEKDRLAALGVMAAGIAHEVNTPITGISSYAQMLLSTTANEDPRYDLLKKVERQTFRASRIVNSLLSLARNQDKLAPQQVDIGELIHESAELLADNAEATGVELDIELPEQRPYVDGSDGQIQQVFTNLFQNALDAMSNGGGQLRVRVTADEDWIETTVEDSGPGIDPEHRDRIFEPFYSTKQSSGGSGLGLSISHEIVRRHGGELRLEDSEEGRGCTVFDTPASFRNQPMNILIVDDEEVLQDVLTALVREEGHEPLCARTGEEALTLLEREEVDLVLLDLMLPGMSGMEVLKQIRERDTEITVVVVTAFSSIEGAIEAMKHGAFHYIPKPFKNEEVRHTIRAGLEQHQLRIENRELKEQLQNRFGFGRIIGKSRAIQQVFDLIRLAAPSKSNILILGESGTGKELVAKSIHHNSKRRDGPFVTVNSGSMPADLLESNLFGHVKGSFTGAISNKKGLFELANGGSIFFDEIGNIPTETQAKLLRVIQEKEFMRLGGVDVLKADVRIIAATNANLEELVESGAFREDLYYRLNVITIHIPPLRKRAEDIPLIAQSFLASYGTENEKELNEIAPAAMQMFLDYHWPGNVRELENAIERAVVLSSGQVLDVDLLPASVGQPADLSGQAITLPSGGVSLKEAVSAYERQLIVKALQASGGVQKRAAELLRVKPTTLHEMMKRLSISGKSLAATS